MGPKNLLYVGFDDSLADQLADVLGDDIELSRETSVESAVERLERTAIDCVVSEATVAGATGIELARKIAATGSGTPVLLVLDDDSPVSPGDVCQSAVDDYVRLDVDHDPVPVIGRRVRHVVSHTDSQTQRDAAGPARERNERELDRLWDILDQAGHTILVTDADGTIEYINDAFESTTGYDRSEAIGADPSLLQSGEHDDAFYESLWETISSGEVWRGELINERKDGTRYPIEQTIAPIANGQGEIERFVAINTDITQRVAYERRLEQYEQIIENLPVGVFRTTPGECGEFVEVNSALVSIYDAYSKDELREHDVCEFYADPDDRAAFSQQLQQEGRVTGMEVTQETLAGDEIEVALTAIRIEEEGTVYFDGILQDITDRKRRERELERKNDQLEQFASIVTHDLRNPLNVAQSRLELARTECDSDHHDVIDQQLVRMEELIEDVLAIARQGRDVEETVPIELGRMAESCWATVDTGGASLVVESGRTLHVDTARVQQLFENLFRNSLEHGTVGPQSGDDTPAEGTDLEVRVGALPDGFYVEDNGPGIPESERSDVFDHGYTTNESGTGFGLNIVAEIVDAHGWTIEAVEGADGGARFEITGVSDPAQ